LFQFDAVYAPHPGQLLKSYMLDIMTTFHKTAVLVMLLFISLAVTATAPQKVNSIMLSQAQLAQYNSEGFLVIPGFFSNDEIKQVAQCADRLQKEAETLSLAQTGKIMHNGTQFVIDRNNGKLQIHRIVWAGSAEPQLLKLARQPKLLVPVAQILESDQADQLINQLHYKLPNDGVKFAWHQDVKNRRTFDPNWEDLNHKGSFVQTIIAIDPNTAENGGMYYVPKSHMRGDLFLDKITDPEELKRVGELDKAVPLVLNPGDIVFMHPYLVHGSEPNESAKPRRIFINGFSYPGANKQPYPGEGSAQRVVLK
jgi:ectoine hydroxylase-related dioxygenase (phytanoyl-CoA dioxygenase family)